jgi:hypothetical protein
VPKALLNLAELYEESENFSEAHRLCKWGLDVSEHVGVDHPDVAELMEQYAALQKKMREIDKKGDSTNN